MAATGMDYNELERSRNELLRQVQRLQEAAVALQRDLLAARHDANKHRQAKNKANQRTRIARLQARFWKELAERRRVERDEARAGRPSLAARLLGLIATKGGTSR
jgi:predicted RNase H-like nuclease (RuvC/YqgF family)